MSNTGTPLRTSFVMMHNAKKRTIMRGPRGGMHIVTAGGAKRYGVKPHYRMNAGNLVSLGVKRKTRKNAGVKRGPLKVPRKSIPGAPTKFLNSKKRVIYVSHRGKFFAMANGRRVYKVKAMHIKRPSGSIRKIQRKHKVPTAIRPARIFGAAIKRSVAGLMSVIKSL